MTLSIVIPSDLPFSCRLGAVGSTVPFWNCSALGASGCGCGMGAVIIWQDGAVVVTSVNPYGPAGVSGEVLVGDHIVEVGGKAVTSVDQARALILGPVGSKFVLKLKRNISSAGFDTFHVLIERRPSTAPNSPQTPAKIGVTESSAPSSSSAIKDSCGPNKIGLQTGPASPRPSISTPDAASQCRYGSESKRGALAPEPSASASDATVMSVQSPIMPSTTHNADAAAVQAIASVQVTQISLSESDSRTHAEKIAQDHPDNDSVSARILNIQAPSDPNVEILGASDERAPLHAACHRKLQFGAGAHELPSSAQSDFSTANEDGSSSSKPPFSSPSASQFVEFEEAAVAAAAAHEHQRVAHWVSLQAREISETDLPLTAENHEALQQKLQEQKLWGMVNSTILSDLMQSLGAKSIFYP